MPLYDYVCDGCKKMFTELVPSSTSPNPSCLGCGGTNVRRMIAAPKFKFDGPLFSKSVVEDKRHDEWGNKV